MLIINSRNLIISILSIRSECVNGGLGPAWRSEPTVSGAVKRRNGEEEEVGKDDANHVGKVRKKEAETENSSPEESPRSDNLVCVS